MCFDMILKIYVFSVVKAFLISGKSRRELHFVRFCKTFKGFDLAAETETIFSLKKSPRSKDFVCKIESNFFLAFCQFRISTGFKLNGTVYSKISSICFMSNSNLIFEFIILISSNKVKTFLTSSILSV